MKKVICIVLAAVCVIGMLSACSTLKKDDKGAIVTMYLANQIYNFDPIVGYNDTATAKILSLAFEGLTVLDEDGDWHKGMMKSYKYLEPDEKEDTYRLEINLRSTKWSDGRTVQANDFVYAWKRIVEATNKCDAACLLYDVKNARDIKMGNATVDDLGIYSVESYVLKIEFEHDINVDEFFKTCASVALVPLREDKIGNDDTWAKRASTMVTNGPFDIRNVSYGDKLVLERSSYYKRDTDSNQALDKYVIPYRLVIKYSYGDNTAQADAFDAGNIFYLGEIALSARDFYKKRAEIVDTPITASLYFNTANRLFEKAEVRRALSLALDRQAIADTLVYAKPATGLVPGGVDDANAKGDFRKTGGDLLATSADVDEAKSLLKSAGVTSGSFSIKVRDNEADVAFAEAVAEAWKSLGFSVKVEKMGTKKVSSENTNQSVIYRDLYQEALDEGDFDVIALDYNMLAPNAFAALAPFATEFSGNGVDMSNDNYDPFPHVTGYSDSDYDDIIDKASKTSDSKERAQLLHDAEEKLMEDMPIVPVLFLQDAYVTSKVISGVKNTYWGRDFDNLKMKNYMKYKESIQAEDSENEFE